MENEEKCGFLLKIEGKNFYGFVSNWYGGQETKKAVLWRCKKIWDGKKKYSAPSAGKEIPKRKEQDGEDSDRE